MNGSLAASWQASTRGTFSMNGLLAGRYQEAATRAILSLYELLAGGSMAGGSNQRYFLRARLAGRSLPELPRGSRGTFSMNGSLACRQLPKVLSQ